MLLHRATSNIVFSNGLLDPWSVFGVTEDVSDSVVAVIVPDGAHHLDLMYSRPDDSQELTAARQTIMQHVARWVQPTLAASVGGADGAAGNRMQQL
jgi:lysosomal Pro-X carboxypeptidase